jgi:hypothetical protein
MCIARQISAGILALSSWSVQLTDLDSELSPIPCKLRHLGWFLALICQLGIIPASQYCQDSQKRKDW